MISFEKFGENQMTQAQLMLESSSYRSAKNELLKVIAEASQKIRGVRPPSGSAEVKEAYAKLLQDFSNDKGREPYFPFLSSGIGAGPYVELMDGSVKMDLITGIGVNFFGHSHPELMAEMIDSVPADLFQGNLQPGIEAQKLLSTILAEVSGKSKLKHGWITTCGTMANENALKMVRQKKAPATKILAFKDCFCGRSTAMAELTDNAGYRQGQPVYGEVEYLSFYSPALGLEGSLKRTLGEMQEHFARYPGKFAALMMEPIQGEGGFNAAPREFYVRVFEEAKKAGLFIWLDEIQTFGRTGELFAFQKLGLDEYVDIVTAAKMLQASVFLWSDDLTPKPGLVAGTFAGPTSGLRAATKTIEILKRDGFLGPQGKIEKLSAQFVKNLSHMRETTCQGMVGEIRAVGGMIAFLPFEGKMDDCKVVLKKLFDLGVVAFYCGHGPYLIRMLPPLGAMTEADIDVACGLIEKALHEVKAAKAGK
jgi:acetylornithine/N-succinyldiaminopimelate aminotransferase